MKYLNVNLLSGPQDTDSAYFGVRQTFNLLYTYSCLICKYVYIFNLIVHLLNKMKHKVSPMQF